jgi:hypothetical protein
MSQLATAPSVQSSREEVWYLKTVHFGVGPGPKQSLKIITQNFNGCVVFFLFVPAICR